MFNRGSCSSAIFHPIDTRIYMELLKIFDYKIKLHSKHVYTVVNANADGSCSTEWVVFTDTHNYINQHPASCNMLAMLM